MSVSNAQGRLAANETAPVRTDLGEKSTASMTVLPPQDHQQAEHARRVRGTLVVVVETPGGKYRRRSYLTLASAERAIRRAEAAGYTASIVLARLEPVGLVA